MKGMIAHKRNSATQQPEQKVIIKEVVRRDWSRSDLGSIQKALEDSIEYKLPPSSLKHFPFRLNRDANILRYQFPELCSSIAEKFQSYTKERKRNIALNSCKSDLWL